MLSVLGVYVYAKLIFVLHSQSIPNLSHSLAEFITDHAFRACFDRTCGAPKRGFIYNAQDETLT